MVLDLGGETVDAVVSSVAWGWRLGGWTCVSCSAVVLGGRTWVWRVCVCVWALPRVLEGCGGGGGRWVLAGLVIDDKFGNGSSKWCSEVFTVLGT